MGHAIIVRTYDVEHPFSAIKVVTGYIFQWMLSETKEATHL